MKRLGRVFDQVLYIVWRDWRDWYAFAWFVVFVAAVFGVGAATWTTVARYTAHDWHVFGVYVLSEFLLFLPFAPDKTKKIRDLDGEVLGWTIDDISRHGYILDLRDRMLGDAFGAALWGGGIGAGFLIGAVVVLRIVHWRNSMQRRRGTGEKRAAPRRWIGLALDPILRLLPASVRFVRESITRRAFAGSAERGETKPTFGNHHVAEAAAGGFGNRRRLAGLLAPLGELTLGPLAAMRSVRQCRTKAAAYWEQRRPALGSCANSEAHEHPPSGTSMPATSPPAAAATAPAGQSETANPVRSGPMSPKPLSPRQDSHKARVPHGGHVALPHVAPTQEQEAATRDDGSNDAASPAPQDARVAPAGGMPGSSVRPPPAGSRLGARRRRPKASQDFY